MRKHSAALLREACHVEHRYTFALEVCRHAQQLTDGDDSSATDPGDQNAVSAIARRADRHRHRLGQRVQIRLSDGRPDERPDVRTDMRTGMSTD